MLNKKYILPILQISTIALLLGRGWQFIFKSTPFSSFFFHTKIMDPVVKHVYQTDWKDYVTNPKWDNYYDFLINGMGIYLWFSILVIIFIQKLPKTFIKLHLWSIFGILFFTTICYWLGKGLQIGQLIEYALQFCCPLFLLYFLNRSNERSGDLSLFYCSKSGDFEQRLKLATAFTFIGHGLYAINFHPRPGFFVDMIIKGFHVTESSAILLLNIVGYLDIIFALALFIPNKLIQKIALYYIIIWGFLTSLARFYSNVNWSSGWYSIKQWLPEFLMRFPHFLIPLVLFILLFSTHKKNA